MGDLEIVVVVVTGVERFVQRVVCDCVQGIAIDPAGVIAVNDLSHKPEIRFYLICNGAKHAHIFKVQYIRGVQPDSVHIELADPQADHIADIVLYIGIVLV